MSGTVVVGATGGCGATTLACLLALCQVDPDRAPVLVGADIHAGGPADAWDVAVTRSLDDLLPLGDELDPAHVDHLTHHHASGVRVIAGPRTPASAMAWHGARARALCAAITAAPAWVADAGRGDTPLAAALLAQASRVLVVAPLTLAGARAARRAIGAAGPMPGGARDAVVVASPVPGGEGLSARAMARALDGHAITQVGRDARGAADVMAARMPGRRSGLARVARDLVGTG